MEVVQSDFFKKWLQCLKDTQARARILKRIGRFEDGNLGDVKPVGEGVSEARIPYGPGYRLYFIVRGAKVMVLLCGGDKSTQSRDIAKAKELAKNWR